MKLNMPEPETEEIKVEERPADPVETGSEIPPVREISQTDHLNKKLLASLMKRMDEGGESLLSKMLEPEEKSDSNDSDEWADS